ncbi:hypothetical protein OFDDKENP_00096 [Aeromonas phage B614]|nr:hypothetical protein OFDDKENP_00096 [Aeromonas phage B614]UYD58177.1 hypothetical protein JNEOFJEA_00080 [Aeromonas phage UP87]UYD58540.1 hypothetical protein IPAKJDPM_00197 [Aeromonas phage avDM14-QBC]UYD58755.1 hypothetical protein HNNIDBEH_00162 [Aeromonas phage avDM10-HWA]UYD58941.1 hypothetical protein OFOPOMKI_00091 [Aeromonas phage avDM7-IJDJ]UYD60000.1 hypothetical protein LEHPIFIF_00244 [Aeromonas phage avDM9-HANS]
MSIKTAVINVGYIASFALFYSMYVGNAHAVLGCAAAVIGSTTIARLLK